MLKPGQKLEQYVMVDGERKKITAVVKGVVKKETLKPAEKQKEQ